MRTLSPAALGRCFVTGAAGFIGSHLVEYLVIQGNSVTGYDNLSSGKRKWIEHLLGDSRFKFLEVDLQDLKV
jgi:nucleoside-diphosphate-sugar epimerase